MEKKELQLLDIYEIDAELNGLRNNLTGEILIKGILQENILLTTKYWLTDFSFTIKEEVKLINEIKDTLIKKYGKQHERGGFFVSPTSKITQEDGSEKEVNNPLFEEYQKEFNEFLKTTKEIEYTPILLSELKGISSEANYPRLFRNRIIKPD